MCAVEIAVPTGRVGTLGRSHTRDAGRALSGAAGPLWCGSDRGFPLHGREGAVTDARGEVGGAPTRLTRTVSARARGRHARAQAWCTCSWAFCRHTATAWTTCVLVRAIWAQSAACADASFCSRVRPCTATRDAPAPSRAHRPRPARRAPCGAALRSAGRVRYGERRRQRRALARPRRHGIADERRSRNGHTLVEQHHQDETVPLRVVLLACSFGKTWRAVRWGWEVGLRKSVQMHSTSCAHTAPRSALRAWPVHRRLINLRRLVTGRTLPAAGYGCAPRHVGVSERKRGSCPPDGARSHAYTDAARGGVGGPATR